MSVHEHRHFIFIMLDLHYKDLRAIYPCLGVCNFYVACKKIQIQPSPHKERLVDEYIKKKEKKRERQCLYIVM